MTTQTTELTTAETQDNQTSAEPLIFTFGDPEPIVNGLEDVLGVYYYEEADYWTPPLSPAGLSKLSRSNATHRRCINFKVSQQANCYIPNRYLSVRDFRRAALDNQVFGYFFFQLIKNLLGQVIGLRHVPALNMRRGPNGRFVLLRPGSFDNVVYQPGEIIIGMQYDTGQSIYGVPDWVGGMNDVFLNSEASLFRRRYYKNGAHMGYILYTTDPKMDKEQESTIRESLANSKGPGNFRSLFVNIPGGDKDAVKLIPVGDIAQKDDYSPIKTISKQDIIIAHGMQPALAGMAPENTGGFGDISKIHLFYRENEVRAHCGVFEELNDQLGTQVFDFDYKNGIDTTK